MRRVIVVAIIAVALAVGGTVYHLRGGAPEGRGKREIWDAVAEGNFPHVATLLADQPELAKLRAPNGESPLHAAALGAPDILRLLLVYGAEVDAGNALSLTPLHMAVSQGELACVRVLLPAGADPSAQDMFGQGPLQYALNSDRQETARVLLAHRAEHTVHTAAAFGDLQALRRIVEENPKRVNHTSPGGRKPMHWAAIYGREEAVRFLVENNALLPPA
ncbi:MAG: ankyrin repeat domain-containing protein [Candidatus Brocadiia bacterium]